MTKKIHVHLIDDLDASEATETMRFEVDGRTYEIDLSSHNARRFRAEIAPYIAHARRVITQARRRGRAGSGPPRAPARAAAPGGGRPGGGQATDVTAGETGTPGYGGGFAPPGDFGGAVVDGHPAGRDFRDEEHPPS